MQILITNDDGIAAYLSSVALLTPGYFEVAMPLGLQTYWAYQMPLSKLVEWLPLALLGLGAMAVRITPAAGAARTTGSVFLTLAGSCYLAYLLGGTAWSYHLLPFHASMLVCLAMPILARLPVEWRTPGLAQAGSHREGPWRPWRSWPP